MAGTDGIMLTDTLLGYAGLLYDKTNTATPVLNLIAGQDEQVQSNEFIMGQEYETGDGTLNPISEATSLTAPDPTFIQPAQKTNCTQIFHESIAVSYAKLSNANKLSGLNLAGQTANPQDVEAAQAAWAMTGIAKKVENMIFNSTYQQPVSNTTAGKTRGLAAAITANVVNANGADLDIWMINDVLAAIENHGGSKVGLTLVTNNVGVSNLNKTATEYGLTIVPLSRNETGVDIRVVDTPNGTVNVVSDPYVVNGSAFLLNLPNIHLVHQPVPGKGNFFIEELAKVGAANKKQIYGQLGLDYTTEYLHGKITGLSTTFTKPAGIRVVTTQDIPSA